jgi:pyroglutamyl-peptidase
MKLLLTGFSTMGGWSVNSSEQLMRSLEAKPLAEMSKGFFDPVIEIMPCDARNAQAYLTNLFEVHSPEVCLLFGQAHRRNKITIERFATNLLDFSYPDAHGISVSGEPLVSEGPTAYQSNLPKLDALVEALQRDGVPAAYSASGGNSLCNMALYTSLHYAEQTDGGMRSGFVHLPVLPEQVISEWPESAFMPLEMGRRAVEIILNVMSS